MNLLPLLSLSSDLNPTENEWGELKRRSTVMELWIWRIWRDSVWRKWSLISCQVFSKLFRHYRRKRLGYVCNPRSLKEGTETSRRMTDELGSRQRDLSTSSVTKRANGHWHAIIASSCRWSQREYKRQPVHRINHVFAEEPSRRPGRPAVVQQLWRRDVTSPFPPSGNEGYIRNRDVPFQSVTPSHVGWPTNWDPYQSATGAAPSSALCRPPDPSYKADDRTGLHREGRLLLSLEQPKQ